MRRAIAVIVLVSFGFVGCATNVTFYTKPEGAEVYVDDEPIGESPARKRMTNAVWKNPKVRAEQEGYYPRTTNVDKEIKAANLLVGILVWWPTLLWAYGPEKSQRIVLRPVEQAHDEGEGEEDRDVAAADAREAERERVETTVPETPEGNEIQRRTFLAVERALEDGRTIRLGLQVRSAGEEESGRRAGPSRNALAGQLLERFEAHDGFQLVEREETDAILEEYEFQMSGLVDEEQLNEVGRLSGITHLLIVEYAREEQGSVLTVEDRRRLLDVSDGTAMAADTTVTTFIWDANAMEYRVVSSTHNGRPVRIEDGRLYPVE
ncbi:MAG: PEGA domain-containing protein [Spirochaetaceae bacterium]